MYIYNIYVCVTDILKQVLELTGDAAPGVGDLYALLQPIFFGL